MNNDTSIESRSKLTLRDIFNWVIWIPKTLKIIHTKTGQAKELELYMRGAHRDMAPPLFILFLFTALHFAVGQMVFDYSAIWSGQKEYIDNLPSDETYTLLENLAFKIKRLWIFFPALFVPVQAVITSTTFRYLRLNFRTHLRCAAIASSLAQILNVIILLVVWNHSETNLENVAMMRIVYYSVFFGLILLARLDMNQNANDKLTPQFWKSALLSVVISMVVFLGLSFAEPKELFPVFHQS